MTRRTTALLVSAIGLTLALLVTIKGVMPPISVIDTDFPNYYTSGWLAVHGRDLAQIYDDSWFQQQMHEAGFSVPGKFSPFPPSTALLAAPLAFFDPQNALRALTLLNVVALLLAMMILGKIIERPFREAALIVLLSGVGLINCFRFGQLYCIVSLSIIAGYGLYRYRKPWLAGIVLGLLLPVKYFPVFLLPFFLLERQWRVAASMLLTAALVWTASILVLGWDVHREYLATVLPAHLDSHYSMQDPFSSTFQSWDSLFLRLFVEDARNPYPLVNAPVLYLAGKGVVLAAILLVSALALFKARQLPPKERHACSIATLAAAALLVAPGTATYHFVLLWLPVALLTYSAWQSGHRVPASIALLAYATIGFLPYSMFHGFEARGVLVPLAYPRLFLLSVLFAAGVAVAFARHRIQSTDSLLAGERSQPVYE